MESLDKGVSSFEVLLHGIIFSDKNCRELFKFAKHFVCCYGQGNYKPSTVFQAFDWLLPATYLDIYLSRYHRLLYIYIYKLLVLEANF